jgi:hypothetical protein
MIESVLGLLWLVSKYFLILSAVAMVLIEIMTIYNLLRLKKQGIPILYYPFVGVHFLFLKGLIQYKDTQRCHVDLCNKYSNVGLFAVNVNLRPTPIIFIVSNQLKKETYANELQHM